MLIEFRVSNYRSFREEQVLRLGATRITEFSENMADVSGKKLLKTIAVYGANSSGKSNLLRGMGAMKNTIFTNFQSRSTNTLKYDPFLLDDISSSKPTTYEIIFITQGRTFRYGFAHTAEAFTKEWLFDDTEGKDEPLFVRIEEGIEVFESFSEGENLESKTRANALFLSVVDQFGGRTAGQIVAWFNAYQVIDGTGHTDYRLATYKLLENERRRKDLLNFYRQLDLGFEDIKVEHNVLPLRVAEESPKLGVEFKGIYYAYDNKFAGALSSVHKAGTGTAVFDVKSQESSGTNKIIDLSGVIFNTLSRGGVLVVDELDAKLHPHLTIAIIKLFQLEESNPNNAQLIFATHNTNILSMGRLRRDQIIFAEKDQYASTRIYPLVNYKLDDRKVRKDNSFEKDYLLGRYGGIPSVQDITDIQ